ncbi:ribonuclease P protein component [Nocardioides sp. JQ2195]|uniref:ribonuclease P protein component n=1 Tax=Nocardioides sp. JQ2195 TaxID=2592334 RepID=UPI00143EDF54|nr:ribonuclease P protein component [Nocardioides sp. JQ2195]QIX28513.1 ribonuclease P protein component [Nocardioides sp. JQ2195]
MLPRENRLTSGDDFRNASRKGRRAGSKTLVVHLWVADGPTTDPARVGFVVSKAVGNAVTRNRVRRRLRHLVRELLAQLPDSGVLVVRALPAAADASGDRLADDLTHCLARVAP